MISKGEHPLIRQRDVRIIHKMRGMTEVQSCGVGLMSLSSAPIAKRMSREEKSASARAASGSLVCSLESWSLSWVTVEKIMSHTLQV